MRKLICIALLGVTLASAAQAQTRNVAAANAQLFEALKAQDPETALYALSQGADARAQEPDGTTPLHYAAQIGDAPLISGLLK